MKKLFKSLFIIACCVSLGLTSCSKDDDDGPAEPKDDDLVEQLQGTWNFHLMKMNVMGQTIEMDLDDIKDNSGYDLFYDDVLTFRGEKVNGSYYEVDGNEIMLPWYVELDWWATVSFSGNKMTMYYNINYEGTPIKMWLTYAKSGSRSMSEITEGSMLPLIKEAINSVRK